MIQILARPLLPYVTMSPHVTTYFEGIEIYGMSMNFSTLPLFLGLFFGGHVPLHGRLGIGEPPGRLRARPHQGRQTRRWRDGAAQTAGHQGLPHAIVAKTVVVAHIDSLTQCVRNLHCIAERGVSRATSPIMSGFRGLLDRAKGWKTS